MKKDPTTNNRNDDPEAWFKQGVAHTEQGEFPAAESCFRRTLRFAPDAPAALLNLGYVLGEQGLYGESLHCYDRVLAAAPGLAEARYNRAAHLLRLGRLPEGFADYEARFAAMQDADRRTYPQPRWDGSPLAGRSILVYGEQGFGDAIMFGRYLPLLAGTGARVTLEVQKPLIPLLSLLDGVDKLVAKSSTPSITDYHIPLLSLPYLFRTTLDTIPCRTPYLVLPEERLRHWHSRLSAVPAPFRIGLAWAGKARPYPNRSCPPEQLAPLLAMQGATFVSLQVGEQDRFPVPPELAGRMTDLTAELGDFADTAALIAHLDLVITIDTAVAHLAGALGKPVWVMLPHAADWRWLLARADSPWYPTMRLYRQERPGDWAGVVGRVCRELRQRLEPARASGPGMADMLPRMLQGAIAQLERGATGAALIQLRKLLLLAPNDPLLLFTLGRAQVAAGELAPAEETFRLVLGRHPGDCSTLVNLGQVLWRLDRAAEAEECFRQALRHDPASTEALLGLAVALFQQRRSAEGLACCEAVLQRYPAHPEARYNMAIEQLLTEDYRSGLANYEARLALPHLCIDGRVYPQPRWQGEPLSGRTILVTCEQGAGDAFQFARYLPLLAGLGGRVVVEAAPEVAGVLETVPGAWRVVARSATPPETECYCQLLSLPCLFGTTIETIPGRVPYLAAAPEKIRFWQEKLADGRRLRVGLVWKGNSRHPNDRNRSCSPGLLAPLAAVDGVSFHSLQVGTDAAEIAAFPAAMVDHAGRLGDYADTAALLTQIDLLITVDTSVAHLAGALARPAWVLLPFLPDWRWGVTGDATPWYPTLRLFRQRQPGDWSGVVCRMRDELATWVAEKTGAHAAD